MSGSNDDEKKETVDFAYAIDCTASMSSYITQVKQDIDNIVTKLETEFPDFQLRLACVGYRDWCDAQRLENFNFTSDISSFKQFVGNLNASGGGDAAEDVLGGLLQATELNWVSNLRVLFHICDAPPHNKMYHNGVSDNYPDGHSSDPADYHKVVLKKMCDKNIHLCIAKLNDSVTKMIDVFDKYGKEIDLSMEERQVNNSGELLKSVSAALGSLAKARNAVKNVKNDCIRLQKELDTLIADSTKFSEETSSELDKIDSGIAQAQDKRKVIDKQIEESKKEFDEMKSHCHVLKTYAKNAKTNEEIEKAENDLLDADGKLTEMSLAVGDARDQVNAILKELRKKAAETETMEDGIEEASKKKKRRNRESKIKIG